jgi:hypothetical protein
MPDGSRLGRIVAAGLRGAPQAALLLGVVAALVLAVARLPGPVVDRMIEGDFRANAQVWQVRILQQIRAGARAFTTGTLAEEDRAFLQAIAHASDFHRLSFFDGERRVFWSSREALVGVLHGGPGAGVPTEPSYDLHALPAVAADDLASRSGAPARPREVARVIEPVTLDGRVVGATAAWWAPSSSCAT